eukprot:353116-Chlamydomonas_euryale.AAC.1
MQTLPEPRPHTATLTRLVRGVATMSVDVARDLDELRWVLGDARRRAVPAGYCLAGEAAAGARAYISAGMTACCSPNRPHAKGETPLAAATRIPLPNRDKGRVADFEATCDVSQLAGRR